MIDDDVDLIGLQNLNKVKTYSKASFDSIQVYNIECSTFWNASKKIPRN